MTPPEQVPDNSEHGRDSWDDWEDFSRAGETTGSFEYNPAAAEITAQHGAFREPDAFEIPEKS